MKINFHGAAGDVTGSANHVKSKRASVLVDCGLYQGGKESRAKHRQRVGIAGGKLDAVALSHAHLDHVGRLPPLTKAGYQGPIYATPATIDLATLILRDAFYLQQADLVRENCRGRRAGLVPHRVFAGNGPSNMILAERLTPETLGSLSALYEHSVFAQGVLWNIDSFDQWGVERGKALAQRIVPELESKPGAALGHDSSTNHLIRRYQRMKDEP